MSPRFIVIGGGFYGACIALYLRSLSKNVTLFERETELFTQASFVNQARVHVGFHYPRSFATAKRSTILYRRFMNDFSDAIVEDFQMLYAISRRNSNTSAARFFQMFSHMGTPIRPASPAQKALFANDMIEDVFQCDEFAFDAFKLRDIVEERMLKAQIDIRRGAEVVSAQPAEGGGLQITLADGQTHFADAAFNATYARLNHLGRPAPHDAMKAKNELTEVVLIETPEELSQLGVTVMDGPFFSVMPFPAEGCYSLTHVRYTPHFSWRYDDGVISSTPEKIQPRSRWRHMVKDSERYLPLMKDAQLKKSLFTTKSVLEMNEFDDGRPIFLHAHHSVPGLYSVLGGKIDNIYDLFAALPNVSRMFQDANTDWVFG